MDPARGTGDRTGSRRTGGRIVRRAPARLARARGRRRSPARRQRGATTTSPPRHYSWDITVPNHALPQPGDAIVLWDKKALLGASIIEEIEPGLHEKALHRCPTCGLAGIKARKTRQPRGCPVARRTCRRRSLPPRPLRVGSVSRRSAKDRRRNRREEDRIGRAGRDRCRRPCCRRGCRRRWASWSGRRGRGCWR